MKWACLLPLLLAFGGACSNAAVVQNEGGRIAQPVAAHRLTRPDGPLLDAANILVPAEEQRLIDQLIGFNKRTGHALIVVTVQSLGGEDIADYTLELFNRWGIGAVGRNDGVVLLVAPNERKVRIATGLGMEKKVPDEVAAQIIGEVNTPRFRTGAMAEGIQDGMDALAAAMS